MVVVPRQSIVPILTGFRLAFVEGMKRGRHLFHPDLECSFLLGGEWWQ